MADIFNDILSMFSPVPQAPTNLPFGAPRPLYMAHSAPIGLLSPGNIDLTRRPVVNNPEGGQSTVFSTSFNVDGKEILVPRVSDDGRIMTPEEAFQNYLRTGRHLGIFDSPQNATSYAQQLHNAYEKKYIPMSLNKANDIWFK